MQKFERALKKKNWVTNLMKIDVRVQATHEMSENFKNRYAKELMYQLSFCGINY